MNNIFFLRRTKYLFITIGFILSLPFNSFAQNLTLSSKAEISVITCGPGEELYSTFGHSAYRIHDIDNKLDRVYNYGTFNFDTPNFYLKFTRGKLLYELRAYNFGHFLKSYHRENRWVNGQVLDLNIEQVQKIYEYLENNAKPENRGYKYDFFYENCSTKMYDVLESVLGDKLVFDNDFANSNMTHRDLIQEYLGNLPWSDFGIDLALGSVIDRKASSKEYMFLPDYVYKAIDKVEIEKSSTNVPIVKRNEEIILQYDKPFNNSFLTPIWFFSIIALLVIFITYKDLKNGTRNKVLDFIIFFVTGITGVILLFLWFGTDHSATVDNFNILWAFAPNLIFAFINKKHRIVSLYFLISLLIFLDVLLLLWIFKVQIFSIALVPILIMLYVRYVYLWFYFKKRK